MHDKTEESGKIFGKLELVRPLPWLLFLPGLVILRIIRVGLNVGAYILGYPRVQASGMVRCDSVSQVSNSFVTVKFYKTRNCFDESIGSNNIFYSISCLTLSSNVFLHVHIKIEIGESTYEVYVHLDVNIKST